jgi:hypothetical protein
MDHVAMRAQQLSQTMTRDMDRLRTQDREQARLLLQVCDAVTAQARETRRTMDRIHQMRQDRTLIQDADMQRDMDRLRLRLTDVTSGLEEMVTTMEQIHARLLGRAGIRGGK